MTWLQRLFLRLLPDAEMETRRWKFDCPCGERSDLWETGGIRYRASGNPWVMVRCPKCGGRPMVRLYKDTYL